MMTLLLKRIRAASMLLNSLLLEDSGSLFIFLFKHLNKSNSKYYRLPLKSFLTLDFEKSLSIVHILKKIIKYASLLLNGVCYFVFQGAEP